MEVVHLVLTLDPNAPIAPPALVPLGLAGYALPLATNVLTTALIVARLWHTASTAEARCRGRMAGTVRAAQHAVAIIVESGLLYLAAQLVLVVLFALSHPAQAVVAVMAVQIYVRISPLLFYFHSADEELDVQGIAPTLIVIRVALGISSDFSTRDAPGAAGPAIAHVSWDVPVSQELVRPGFVPGMHSFSGASSGTEQSGPTLQMDAEYMEMKAYEHDQCEMAVAV